MAPTLKEIAARANVSTTTVSLVLNNKANSIGEETRLKVQSIADELNYKPNKIALSLKTSRTFFVALLFPETFNPANPYYMGLSVSLAKELNSRGYDLIILNTLNDEKGSSQHLQSQAGQIIEGLFVVSRSPYGSPLEEQLDSRVKVVYLDEPFRRDEIGGVLVTGNNVKGGYLAGKHLLEYGHRKVACVLGTKNTANSIKRLEGFLNACRDYDLTEDQIRIFQGNYNYTGGYEAGLQISGSDITGAFCFNDLSAYGCIKGLKAKGVSVPTDISIVGYDNLVMDDYLEPGLTTIDQSATQIGQTAADIMVRLIESNQVKDLDYLIEPQLIVRNTTTTL